MVVCCLVISMGVLSVNYYDVLGVARNADPAVIRAAYKVLVQKYHPDRYSGSDCKEKMTWLNLAFETLSDANLRRVYDEGLKDESVNGACFSAEDSGGFIFSSSDWEYACKYTPELKEIDVRLAAISAGLSGFFRALILETKDFHAARKVAADVELNYLQRYFGSNPKIVNYARDLLLSKRLEAAK